MISGGGSNRVAETAGINERAFGRSFELTLNIGLDKPLGLGREKNPTDRGGVKREATAHPGHHGNLSRPVDLVDVQDLRTLPNRHVHVLVRQLEKILKKWMRAIS